MNCNDLGKFKIKKQKTLVDFFYYCKRVISGIQLILQLNTYKLTWHYATSAIKIKNYQISIKFNKSLKF